MTFGRPWTPTKVAVAVAIAVAVVVRVLTAVHLGDLRGSGDVNRFFHLAKAHGRPAIDYAVEYPIGTLGLLKLLGAIAHSRGAFGHAVVLLAVIADLGVAGALLVGWGTVAAAFYFVAVTPMINLLDARLDLLSTFVVVVSLLALRRGRERTSGAGLAAACALKLWAAPLVLAAAAGARSWRRVLVAAAAVGAVVLVVWVALSGTDGPVQVLTYRHAKGWEIESIAGLAMVARHAGHVSLQEGALRIGVVSPFWRVALWVIGLPLALWASVRGGATRRLGVTWIAGVGVMLLTSTLLSPQFIVWLLPAAAIAWVEGDRVVALAVAACAPLTGLEMHSFGGVIHGDPYYVTLVAARNALLVAAVVLSFLEIRRASREPAAQEATA